MFERLNRYESLPGDFDRRRLISLTDREYLSIEAYVVKSCMAAIWRPLFFTALCVHVSRPSVSLLRRERMPSMLASMTVWGMAWAFRDPARSARPGGGSEGFTRGGYIRRTMGDCRPEQHRGKRERRKRDRLSLFSLLLSLFLAERTVVLVLIHSVQFRRNDVSFRLPLFGIVIIMMIATKREKGEDFF